jgi:hypothetical protein
MRKFKIGLVLLVVLFIAYLMVENYLFTTATYHCNNCRDEIRIHFIHGSFPKKNCEDQRIRVGGLLGGHVEIEVDSLVFGFEFEHPNQIHIFSKEDPALYNSTFTKKTKAFWLQETEFDKMTSIYIPVSAAQKETLLSKLHRQHLQAPYDYSFFGMRCASSTYEDLVEIGIFSQKSRRQYILNAFYPRLFRNKMWKWANKNNLEVVLKSGIECRVWE